MKTAKHLIAQAKTAQDSIQKDEYNDWDHACKTLWEDSVTAILCTMILIHLMHPDLRITWKQLSDCLVDKEVQNVSAEEGMTNTADGKLRPLDPHNHANNEGEIIYDILYKFKIPKELTLLEDLEFQVRLRHTIGNRSFFYIERLEGAAKNREFRGNDWGSMPDSASLWIELMPPAYLQNSLVIHDLTRGSQYFLPNALTPARREMAESMFSPTFQQVIYSVGTGPLPNPIVNGTFKVPDDIQDLVIFCDVMCNILHVEKPEEYLNYLLKKYGAPEEIYKGKKAEEMLAVSQILAESYRLQGIEEEKAKEEKVMEGKMAESRAQGITEGMAKGKAEGVTEGITKGKTAMASAMIKEGADKSFILKTLVNSGMSEADAEKLYDQLAAKEK